MLVLYMGLGLRIDELISGNNMIDLVRERERVQKKRRSRCDAHTDQCTIATENNAACNLGWHVEFLQSKRFTYDLKNVPTGQLPTQVFVPTLSAVRHRRPFDRGPAVQLTR